MISSCSNKREGERLRRREPALQMRAHSLVHWWLCTALEKAHPYPSLSYLWEKTQRAGGEASENRSFRDISLHGGTTWCSRSYIMVARKLNMGFRRSSGQDTAPKDPPPVTYLLYEGLPPKVPSTFPKAALPVRHCAPNRRAS